MVFYLTFINRAEQRVSTLYIVFVCEYDVSLVLTQPLFWSHKYLFGSAGACVIIVNYYWENTADYCSAFYLILHSFDLWSPLEIIQLNWICGMNDIIPETSLTHSPVTTIKCWNCTFKPRTGYFGCFIRLTFTVRVISQELKSLAVAWHCDSCQARNHCSRPLHDHMEIL